MHHDEVLGPATYVELLPDAIWHNDEPLCHPNSVHIMHLSAIAQRYVTVVLTGEGADEVFFGYPRLHIARLSRMLGRSRHAVAAALSASFRNFSYAANSQIGRGHGQWHFPGDR